MPSHPFLPEIPNTANKLLVGTLPPEGAPFYFSNSSNTRLWDILIAIRNGDNVVGKGGNDLPERDKKGILQSLNLGISDIILRYERDIHNSTWDSDINPLEYKDLIQLAIDLNIDEFLFVYASALKWFTHSLQNAVPVRLKQINTIYRLGRQEPILINGRTFQCTLLPSPLNRGRRGETLLNKLQVYRTAIVGP